MIVLWLLLYLATLVHLLALYGYRPGRGAGPLLLLPVVAMTVLPAATRRWRVLVHPVLIRALGAGAALAGVLFVRRVYLDAWDTWRWGPGLLVAGAGLASLAVALGRGPGLRPGHWLWASAWLLGGYLDPALPLLGACLMGLLPKGLAVEPIEATELRRPLLALFLVGMAFPKPWWDFDLDPRWAWGLAAFGIGAFFASLPRARGMGGRFPEASLRVLIGLFAVLYHPAFLVPWGLGLGLLMGLLWPRLPRRVSLAGLAGGFLGGLLLSFILHANAWIPGLRHLIWLGN